ncbi:hypothetical protein TSMEX_005739 [Taenia solium]|eukprot:TsM_000517200 transcript=TsM_000517200 gene=TsM_000517200
MNSNVINGLPAVAKFERSGSGSYISAVIDWAKVTYPIHVQQPIMESITDPRCKDYTSDNVLVYPEKFCPDFVETFKVVWDKGFCQ